MPWSSHASINKHSKHFLNNWNIHVNLQDSHCKTSAKKPTLDPNDLKIYRPIANLSFLLKVLKKVVLAQVFFHLNSQNLKSNFHFQSAYYPGHSTETALLKVSNDLLTAMDTDKVSVLTLLDLSTAFHTVDRDILLHSSEHTFGF